MRDIKNNLFLKIIKGVKVKKSICVFLIISAFSCSAGADEVELTPPTTGTQPSKPDQPTWDPDWQRKYNEEAAKRAAAEDARRRNEYLAAEAAMKREIERKKACSAQKASVEKAHSSCLESSAGDNSREIMRCELESNNSWSGSIQGGHQFLLGGISYTVENPTYDKCVNRVTAAFIKTDRYCESKYTDDKNTARIALDARCADFFQ